MTMGTTNPNNLAQVSPELADIYHKFGIKPAEEGSASGIGGGIERGVNRMANAWKKRQWDQWRMDANSQRVAAEGGAVTAAITPPSSPADVATSGSPVAPTTSRPSLPTPSQGMGTTHPAQFSQSGAPYEQPTGPRGMASPPPANMSPAPWASQPRGMAAAPPQMSPMSSTQAQTGPAVPAQRPFAPAASATQPAAQSSIPATYSDAVGTMDPRIRGYINAMAKFDPGAARKMVETGMAPYVDQGRMIDLQKAAGAERRTNEMHPLDMDAKRASVAAAQAQLEQVRTQTPDWRAANAERFGLQKGTPEYNQFVIAGTYAPKDDIVRQKDDEQIFQRVRKPDGSYDFVPVGGGSQGAPQQRTFDKAFAKEQAPKLYAETTKAFQDASSTVNTIEDLSALSKHASTGWGAGGINEMRRIASRFGFAPESVRDATTATETFRALTQKFVLSEGQKLKPMSNADIQFVEKGLATIMSDPNTLPVLLPALKAEAQRSAMAHQLTIEYLRRGVPPDPARIEEQVDARIPSVIRQIYGGQAGQQDVQPRQQRQPVHVKSPAEAMKLPPGTPILLPDGTVGHVPAQSSTPMNPGVRQVDGATVIIPTGR